MADRWLGVVFGTFLMLVGLAQAWRPAEAAQFSNRTTPRMFRIDWANDLWLIRLVGIIGALAGLGILTYNLQSA